MQLKCGCSGINLSAGKTNNYNSHGRPILHATNVCVDHKIEYKFPPECYYYDGQILIFECGCCYGSFTHTDAAKTIETYRYQCDQHCEVTERLVNLQTQVSAIQNRILREIEVKFHQEASPLLEEIESIINQYKGNDPFIVNYMDFRDY